jgi:transposase
MTKAQVEVITSVQRRRSWSRAEKERIVAAALGPGAVASEVARAAAIHTSQFFRWRRQLCERTQTPAAFNPVAIAPEREPGPVVLSSPSLSSERAGTVEIEFATGGRMRITGPVDAATADQAAGKEQMATMIPFPNGARIGWRPAIPTCARALMAWRSWCRRCSNVIRTAGICSYSAADAAASSRCCGMTGKACALMPSGWSESTSSGRRRRMEW